MTQIKVLESIQSIRQWRRETKGQIGFFPTMGALHEGHAASLRLMRKHFDKLVLSIFVNPTQFGPTEDFQRYPRTLFEDLKIAEGEGVDAVFVPTAQVIYPEGFSTEVEECELSKSLCGKFRPGHFKGVATVVLKLLNVVQPHAIGLGLKDAQQFFIVSKILKDLNVEIRCLGLPLRREPDGLAMSSRNRYLKPEQRGIAPRLHRELERARKAIEAGEAWSSVQQESQKNLSQGGFEVQYFDCLQVPSFKPRADDPSSQLWLIAVAAKLGETRLIDNVFSSEATLLKGAGFELLND